MYHVGIISKPGRSLTTVRAELSRTPYFKLQVYTDAPNAVSALKARMLNGLIVIVDNLTQEQLVMLSKIRHFHPHLPIVLMAEHMEVGIQQKALNYPNTIALDARADMNDLPGVVVRLIKGQKVYNRSSKRQPTMQTASIALESNEFFDQACLLDLAGGGARLRAFKKPFEKGDKFRLKIPLTFLRKTYVVDAEVVWSHPEKAQDGVSRSHLMGLKFLSVAG